MTATDSSSHSVTAKAALSIAVTPGLAIVTGTVPTGQVEVPATH